MVPADYRPHTQALTHEPHHPERLASLKGGKIIVFPDVDAFKDWQQKIFTFPHLDIRISRLLEDKATPADREAHIDLADWLIKHLEDSNA